MADILIKGKFKRSLKGGSNISTVLIPTTGIATGDVVTVQSGLIGTSVQRVTVVAPALGASTSVEVGYVEGSVSDDNFFVTTASTVQALDKSWAGIKETGKDAGFDFTVTFTGNPTDNKNVVLQAIYQNNI